MAKFGPFGFVSKKEYNALEREIAAIKATTGYSDWLLETGAAEKYTLPDPSTYAHQAEMFRRLSWVLQAVNMVASAGALTDFEVARIVAGKEPKDIPNHEFEFLLQHPNDMDSRYEFLYATIAYWKLNGNAYWHLNRVDENSKPDELWVIPPSMISPVPDGKMFLKGYVYYPGNGREIFMEPWQILHFKSFNPFSRFLGLSAMESIALVAHGDLGMQDWNTRLFKENNARLPGILTFEQFIEQGTWDKIKDDTREASRKRDLLMLRGVGQGGVNWLQNAVSQKDMEFLAGRKFNREEIYNTLAPGAYSMVSENATEANSLTGRAVFNELSVYPMHVMMGEKITNGILPVYGGRPLIGKFEDVRVSDRALSLKEQEEYAKSHTIAEIRQEFYGDDPLGDDRDALLPIEVSYKNIAQTVPSSVDPEAQNGNPGANPKAPTQPQQGTSQQQGAQQTDPGMPMNEPAAKAARDELERWERKALKSIGRTVQFSSNLLPSDVSARINAGLPRCTDGAAIKALFNRVSNDVYPMSDAALHLEGLKLAVMALEGRK